METELLKTSEKAIERASELIRNGEIVAVPTETVYGIAGNAYNGEAIKKIFIAKGRPQDNPLIVHISDMEMLKEVVTEITEDVKKLAQVFWPGALTMIMPKSEKVSPVTTAGLDSVGVRMPSDKTAHEIIKRSGVPFAAPSANISGKPSPTKAEDVYADMKGRLRLIIDGGESQKGVESTVISMLNKTPILLRPGVITKEDIERVLGKEIEVSTAIVEKLEEGEKVLSPGMKYKHYSPEADVTIIDGELEKFIEYVRKEKESKVVCMCFDGEENKIGLPCVTYGIKGDGESQAKRLFSALRELDKMGAKKAYARCPERVGVSLAVYNRLLRSAGFKVIKL